MVRDLKSSVGKVVRDGVGWADALDKCVFVYRRRSDTNRLSPFELLYRVEPHLTGSERDKSFTL